MTATALLILGLVARTEPPVPSGWALPPVFRALQDQDQVAIKGLVDQAYAKFKANPPDLDGAQTLFDRALEQATRSKMKALMAEAKNGLGRVAIARHQNGAAARFFEDAAKLAEEAEELADAAVYCHNVLDASAIDDPSLAVRQGEKGLTLALKVNDANLATDIHTLLVLAYRHQGDLDKALLHARDAVDGFALETWRKDDAVLVVSYLDNVEFPFNLYQFGKLGPDCRDSLRIADFCNSLVNDERFRGQTWLPKAAAVASERYYAGSMGSLFSRQTVDKVEALSKVSELGSDSDAKSRVLFALAALERDTGWTDRALNTLGTLTSLYDTDNSPLDAVSSISSRAELLTACGRLDEAETACTEAMRRLDAYVPPADSSASAREALEDIRVRSRADLELRLGAVALERAQGEAAATHLKTAFELLEERRLSFGELWESANRYVDFLTSRDQSEQAAALLKRLCAQVDPSTAESRPVSVLGFAFILISTGLTEEARRLPPVPENVMSLAIPLDVKSAADLFDGLAQRTLSRKEAQSRVTDMFRSAEDPLRFVNDPDRVGNLATAARYLTLRHVAGLSDTPAYEALAAQVDKLDRYDDLVAVCQCLATGLGSADSRSKGWAEKALRAAQEAGILEDLLATSLTLAKALDETGQEEQARQVLEDAEREFGSKRCKRLEALVRLELAEHYAAAGDNVDAASYAKRAGETLETLAPTSDDAIRAVVCLGTAYLRSDQVGAAIPVLEKAQARSTSRYGIFSTDSAEITKLLSEANAKRGPERVAAAAPTGPQQRVALVVSCDAYDKWNPLSHPNKEADQVASILEQSYGFRVIRVPDATYEAFTKAVVELQKIQAGTGSQLFVYVAGHGSLSGGLALKDSLLPQDDPLGGQGKMVGFGFLQQWLTGDATAAYTSALLVLDICYGGMLVHADQAKSQLSPAYTEKPNRIEPTKGLKEPDRCVLFITSGYDNPVPDKSTFAERFIRAIQEAGQSKQALTFEALTASVRPALATPDERVTYGQLGSASIVGHFELASPSGGVTAGTGTPNATGSAPGKQ